MFRPSCTPARVISNDSVPTKPEKNCSEPNSILCPEKKNISRPQRNVNKAEARGVSAGKVTQVNGIRKKEEWRGERGPERAMMTTRAFSTTRETAPDLKSGEESEKTKTPKQTPRAASTKTMFADPVSLSIEVTG